MTILLQLDFEIRSLLLCQKMALSTFGRSQTTKKVPGIELATLHFTFPSGNRTCWVTGRKCSLGFFLGAFLSASSVDAKRVILMYLPLPVGSRCIGVQIKIRLSAFSPGTSTCSITGRKCIGMQMKVAFPPGNPTCSSTGRKCVHTSRARPACILSLFFSVAYVSLWQRNRGEGRPAGVHNSHVMI